MKTLLTTLTILFFSCYLTAQDTTSNRMIMLSPFPATIVFLDNNFDVLAGVPIQNVDPSGSTGHGLFVSPLDRKLYGMIDSSSFTSRSVQTINPLDGARQHLYNPQEAFASMEVTDSGRVFAITGNNSPTPGAVYELNLQNQTKTLRYNSAVPAFEPRALGFNTTTQSLVVFSGYIDSIYTTPLNVWNETSSFLNMQQEEIHGTYFRNDTFILSSYYDIVLQWAVGDTSAQTAFTPLAAGMDITELKLIDAETSQFICPNGMLEALYTSSHYKWFLNGTAIPNSNSKQIAVTSPGTYRLLTQIGNTANYIWSEEISISLYTSPVVSLSGTDTLICPNDTILITGNIGGNSQWYLNGLPIAGATANTYEATSAGSYNMIKTNTNGCSDSAQVPYVITVDPDCFVAVDEHISTPTTIYPNPANDLLWVNSGDVVIRCTLLDVQGKVVFRSVPGSNHFSMDIQSLTPGLYLLQLETSGTSETHRIIKH